jgi:hypothetical protein
VSEQISEFEGLRCLKVTFDSATEQWLFHFDGSFCLQVSSPWRVIEAGAIKLGWKDHGQQFGLPSPIDGMETATRLLGRLPVEAAFASAETADLSIAFGPSSRLEIFNDSAGYEGWILNGPSGEYIVAQGGGRLVRRGRQGTG